MKKNTKKKMFTLALVICLLAIAMVGGSLAWFTAEDEATNTFTVGSIKIEQKEEFEQNSQLLPVVPNDTETPSDDANYVKKEVTVKNTGKNSAYIRTFIAVPAALEPECLKLDIDGTDWTLQWAYPTFEYNGVEYVSLCYVYNKPLESGETTPMLLKGVYLDASVDLKNDPANANTNLEFCRRVNGEYVFTGFEIADENGKILKNIDVLVRTEAVQVQGFESEGPQGALNTAFGSLNDGYHPFVISE